MISQGAGVNLSAMQIDKLRPDTGEGFSEDAWVDVLRSIDRTYQELVEHHEELDKRNQELEAMRGFLHSVLAAMSDVLLVCGPEGQVLEANRALLELTAAKRDALLGTPVQALFDPSERDGLKRDFATLKAGGAIEAQERALATPEGPTPLELSITARLDHRRRFAGVVLIGRPVGELRRAYEEVSTSHRALKEAQSQLVHSEKLASLGRLLAGVAHELNNPISFVYGNAHALERYCAKFESYFERVEAGASRDELIALRQELKLDRAVKQLRSAVSGALEGAERVRDIVGSLRRLSAEGSGKPEAFDLAETAETAALWVIKGRAVAVEHRFEAEGPVTALARPGHIQQVIMNLVQNALDAMSEMPSPQLDLSVRREDDQAVLEVADRGPGIAADVALKVFDPFFTTKPVGQGTGLGLSISYKIVEENGGSLDFRPREGGGSIFRLTLPSQERHD